MNAFTFLVLADTQYLFDGERQRPDLLAQTFREAAELVAAGAVAPVRHVIHVGDVTEHGRADEAEAALRVLDKGRRLLGGPAVTIATGNHDVAHHSDDQRGPTEFGAVFGPGCALLEGAHAGPVQHGPGGYSSWRTVDLPDGTHMGVLALDWRPSPDGWRWADQILSAHPGLPTVLVSHETALHAELTQHGLEVERLVDGHDQVFLALGGHEWPSTRVVRPGREFHAVNYQELPFGGAGAARLYEFHPVTGACQVISICPALRHPDVLRSVAARRALALHRPEDQFTFPLPAALGGGPGPWQARGLELKWARATPGEFDMALPDDFVIEVDTTLPHRRVPWQVLLARLGPAPHGSPEPSAALSVSSEGFVGWMAYTPEGEVWATSHEYPAGARVKIVISNRARGGVWIDGDPIGRAGPGLGDGLFPGPWRWRLGAGEYEGAPADPYLGVVHQLRVWA